MTRPLSVDMGSRRHSAAKRDVVMNDPSGEARSNGLVQGDHSASSGTGTGANKIVHHGGDPSPAVEVGEEHELVGNQPFGAATPAAEDVDAVDAVDAAALDIVSGGNDAMKGKSGGRTRDRRRSKGRRDARPRRGSVLREKLIGHSEAAAVASGEETASSTDRHGRSPYRSDLSRWDAIYAPWRVPIGKPPRLEPDGDPEERERFIRLSVALMESRQGAHADTPAEGRAAAGGRGTSAMGQGSASGLNGILKMIGSDTAEESDQKQSPASEPISTRASARLGILEGTSSAVYTPRSTLLGGSNAGSGFSSGVRTGGEVSMWDSASESGTAATDSRLPSDCTMPQPVAPVSIMGLPTYITLPVTRLGHKPDTFLYNPRFYLGDTREELEGNRIKRVVRTRNAWTQMTKVDDVPILKVAARRFLREEDSFCSVCGGSEKDTKAGRAYLCELCPSMLHGCCLNPPVTEDCVPSVVYCQRCVAKRCGPLLTKDMQRLMKVDFQLLRDSLQDVKMVATSEIPAKSDKDEDMSADGEDVEQGGGQAEVDEPSDEPGDLKADDVAVGEHADNVNGDASPAADLTQEQSEDEVDGLDECFLTLARSFEMEPCTGSFAIESDVMSQEDRAVYQLGKEFRFEVSDTIAKDAGHHPGESGVVQEDDGDEDDAPKYDDQSLRRLALTRDFGATIYPRSMSVIEPHNRTPRVTITRPLISSGEICTVCQRYASELLLPTEQLVACWRRGYDRGVGNEVKVVEQAGEQARYCTSVDVAFRSVFDEDPAADIISPAKSAGYVVKCCMCTGIYHTSCLFKDGIVDHRTLGAFFSTDSPDSFVCPRHARRGGKGQVRVGRPIASMSDASVKYNEAVDLGAEWLTNTLLGSLEAEQEKERVTQAMANGDTSGEGAERLLQLQYKDVPLLDPRQIDQIKRTVEKLGRDATAYQRNATMAKLLVELIAAKHLRTIPSEQPGSRPSARPTSVA